MVKATNDGPIPNSPLPNSLEDAVGICTTGPTPQITFPGLLGDNHTDQLISPMPVVLLSSVEDGCVKGTADSFDLPQFIKFDLQKKMIFEVGETSMNRKSEIVNLTNTEDELIMQGVENGRSWSAVIGEQGKMTATVSESKFGFVIFGACLRQ